ncbi:hypothetical protein [Pseudoalteromonas sp. NZS100]|uniref:hypothetical protein n=1 Tax=Pseudoalteromonas sp. NZS100 TaxID=2792046 RepID=UPI0018CF4E48|nr:hypothetical protein [Pseudoalteromonas sp. NZS100]MBH0066777.1 hypothetical protein [Pseudoalteromonas sp. NZS100]
MSEYKEILTRYPIEELLNVFRNNQDMVFVYSDFELGYNLEYIKSYELLLDTAGINQTELNQEEKLRIVHDIIDRLVKDDFLIEWTPTDFRAVTYQDRPVHCLFLHRAFTLSSQGIELVLKVEAHNDAERRHTDTHKHNTLMRWIAGSSFLLSLVAVSVSAYLAYIANQNMQLNQQRLEIQQQQIKALSHKVIEELPAKPETTKPAN